MQRRKSWRPTCVAFYHSAVVVQDAASATIFPICGRGEGIQRHLVLRCQSLLAHAWCEWPSVREGILRHATAAAGLSAALTSEQVNEKMDLLSMEFSSGTSEPFSKMPKKQNKKKLQDGEEKLSALKHTADDDNRTSGSTWIETLKTCLLSPFEVVAKCGGEGSISDAVRRTVVRRTLYPAWTGSVPVGACVKPSRRGKICGKRRPSL